jgi:(p)ppGpp synthase/HD superfamily hydrolase
VSAAELLITPRYGESLVWAEQIHRDQRRKGKNIPYISYLISVSALLHDAIEDAGQSHASIAERFGSAVADIVRDCTDTNGTPGGGEKEPWLLRKTRTIASLEHKPDASLLVTAADKAHNAGDMVLDARRDPGMWSKFNAGLEGSAWYLLRMHQQLKHRLPKSRSVERLGESMSEVLASESYRRLVPGGLAPAVWAAGYAERLAAEEA